MKNFHFGLVFILSLLLIPAHGQNVNSNSIFEKNKPVLETKNPFYNLKLQSIKSNTELTYVTYDVTYQGRPIDNYCVKQIFSTANSTLIKTYSELPNFDINQTAFPLVSISEVSDIIFYKSEEAWMIENNSLLPVLKLYTKTADESRTLEYNLNTKKLISNKDNSLHLVTKDSMAHAKLFRPDPLTSAHIYYGHPIKDSSDLDYPAISNQRVMQEFECKFDIDSNKFKAESKYVILKDIQMPLDTISLYFIDSIDVSRNNFMFENLMALNHISKLQNTISALGVINLSSRKIEVDAHAQSGADNSQFTSFADPTITPQIKYGTGGVDDAEDPDVILHEYGHALSHFANGGLASSFTNERRGLDEGYGDYFATRYSASIDTFSRYNMFTWDGHNEYWPGRKVITPEIYSTSVASGNIYTIGEIWNNALTLAGESSGKKDKVLKLAFESLFLLNNTTTLPQAANYILDLDSILFNKELHGDLCFHFTMKNILNTCTVPAGLNNTTNTEEIKLINSTEYSHQNIPLQIQLPNNYKTITIQILDLAGRIVFQHKFANNSNIQIQPNLSNGMYILTAICDKQIFNSKFNLLR